MDEIRKIRPLGYGADQMRIDAEQTARTRAKHREKKPDKPFDKVLLDKEKDIVSAEEEKKRKSQSRKSL